jgi:hydrogenase maturation protease
MSTLLICYGNPLRGDDGLGWHAAERLRAIVRDPEVEILALHQLTPELMEAISRADRVIFIDACEGAVPGEIHERSVVPAAAGAAFTHHMTPSALLAGAIALYGHAPQATLLTVTGADFSVSDQLSPAVSTALDALVTLVSMALRHVS